jgi:hypothetical protein
VLEGILQFYWYFSLFKTVKGATTFSIRTLGVLKLRHLAQIT